MQGEEDAGLGRAVETPGGGATAPQSPQPRSGSYAHRTVLRLRRESSSCGGGGGRPWVPNASSVLPLSLGPQVAAATQVPAMNSWLPGLISPGDTRLGERERSAQRPRRA